MTHSPQVLVARRVAPELTSSLVIKSTALPSDRHCNRRPLDFEKQEINDGKGDYNQTEAPD